MQENKVIMALKLPKQFMNKLDNFLNDQQQDCIVQKKVSKQLSSNDELGFDPFTGTELLWTTLSFIGTFSANVAASLIATIIYEATKKEKITQDKFELEVHFPDTKKIIVRSNEPVDIDYLAKIIKVHGGEL